MTVRNYGLVTSIEELKKFRDLVLKEPEFAIDIETGYEGLERANASVHVEEGLVAGFSFTSSLDWARYVPIHHWIGSEHNLNPLEVARMLWPWLRTGKGIAHNNSFEFRFLASFFREYLSDDQDFGAEVKSNAGYFDLLSDSMSESYLVAETKSHALKYLSKQVLNHEMTELADLFPNLPDNKKKFLRFNMLDPSEPKNYEYACDDSVQSLALHRRNYPKVKDTKLYKIEHAVTPIVCRMEDFGIKFDWELLRNAAEQGSIFIEKLNAEIQSDFSKLLEREMSNPVNLSSPAQLREIFYNELGETATRFTKGSKQSDEKKGSTDKITLKLLSKKYPVVEKILMWKSVKTLLNNFVVKFEKAFSFAPDGMVHPSHLQSYVITGRFSVSGPNYQQLPKKYYYKLNDGFEFKLNFRDAICSPTDHYIIGFDMSQIQLRIIAGEAQEPTLLKSYEDGEDVHTRTTSLMLNIPIEDVTDELRSIGKTLNFSLLFGLSPKTLGDRLGISTDEAASLFNKYFSTYSAIKVWVDKQKQFGHKHGYVVEPRFGRKMPIWEFLGSERWLVEHGERACVNFPIQCGESSYVKYIMVRADKALEKAGLKDRVHLVMNIHDALEFYAHVSVSPKEIINVLQPAIIFDVPPWPKMEAQWHIGKRWGSLLDIELMLDGRLMTKPKDGESQELNADVDEPETEMLPLVSPEALRQAVAAPARAPAPHGDVPAPTDSLGGTLGEDDEPKTILVEITELPLENQLVRFKSFVDERPGLNSVTMITPQGSFLVTDKTSVTPHDRHQISIILGGASVKYAVEDTGNILSKIQF